MSRVAAETQRLPNRDFADLMAAVLEKGLPFRFQAAGASMSPFIRGGDVLTMAPLRGAPRTGDVLAFIQPASGRLMVHRVIAGGTRGVLLRGDNGCHADGWVEPEKIIGRVQRIERQSRPVRFGLGPEKRLIALLSRLGLLRATVRPLLWLLRPVYKRFFS